MKPQTISVRDKRFFICDYTGAPITKRYYIPVGKHQKGKDGCYATLPVLMRHHLWLHGGKIDESFAEFKRELELFYNQPDIPFQPELPEERVPLSQEGLEDYLAEMNMGLAWLDVPKAESVDELPKKKLKSV